MFKEIADMCPMWGIGRGFCKPGDIEDRIEVALLNLLGKQQEEYMRGLVKATYSAYVSMTVSGCEWKAIRLMFSAMGSQIE